MTTEHWPALPFFEWTETRETLHRWLEIIGKLRLSKTRWTNHSWHVPLYVTSRGLTTSVIHDREKSFGIELDFVAHLLTMRASDGRAFSFPLQPESVAAFHQRFFAALEKAGIPAHICEKPNETPDSIPLAQDDTHLGYDREFANRFWRILLQADRLMKIFRSDFVGKASPVHFFWGSNDLAVGRFSGRRAPEHPGGMPNLPDLVTKEAYSHEVSSCGFWPGSSPVEFAAFFSYAYPAPEGFEKALILPREAFFHDQLREFILPYDAVRSAPDPDRMVLDFFQSTYEAAANLGHWDRENLEPDEFLKLLQDQSSSPGHRKAA